ncbi:MFS transporter [Evansella sp. AB-P1]|uniref:MFS transporter n=1 Tax=Evansella sp. AB-P1 TaxID=3037653 RepID=UPI00241D93C5|nr:MFS transporter [Evansella sp. AB-P1]MDG5786411.1 MFS transporter [Evansella sp. AB-P1]
MQNRNEKFVLYIILFLIFISIHMQFPVFTPLAVSLGAGSLLVGIMLSATSFVNLTGNMIAGSYIDRYGSKMFIVFPLFLLSISLFAHTFVVNTTTLFILRIINGFVLAFLTPACMTLLASFAKNSQSQSKNMAMNTFMVTLAMAVAPVIGGFIGERFGADGAYYVISFTTGIAFLLSIFYLSQPRVAIQRGMNRTGMLQLFFYPPLLPVFLTGFAIMFSQGTLMYELPFLSIEQGMSKSSVGQMAGVIGIGTLLILSFITVHRISAKVRTLFGLCIMAGALCWIMILEGIPSFGSLILFGIASGLIFPALMTLVVENINEGDRGKAFAFLSAVFSVGTISSPFIAGIIRVHISPFYVAWLVMMLIITMLGLIFITSEKSDQVVRS